MIGDPHVIDIVELEGRDAYKRGERWQSTKPELWRKGWRDAQLEHGPERRRTLKILSGLCFVIGFALITTLTINTNPGGVPVGLALQIVGAVVGAYALGLMLGGGK